MRNNRLNYIIVGSFVLAMLMGLVVAIAMLSGRTGAVDMYHAVYRNVTGVKFGTQVLYEGFPIGQVEDVTPIADGAAMSFRVDFSVAEGWRIPDDSVAKIAAPGLLSAITLSLSAGESGTALEPGARVRGEESANVFAVVSSVADQISLLAEQDLRPLLNNINPLLESITRSSDGLGDLIEGDATLLLADGRTLISDLSVLSADLSGRLPAIAGEIEQITGRIKGSSEQLGALLSEDNRKQVENLIANMDQAATNFTRLSGNLDGLIGDLEAVVDGNRDNIGQSLTDVRYVADSLARHIDVVNQNMEAASRNMYEFSRQIRQNPGLLLGGTPPRDEAGNQ